MNPATDEDVKTMMRFYQVETERQLIAALNHHVERLVKKVPPARDTQPGRVREG